MADDPKLARRAILDAVENQLRENSPPEANATLERLTAAGYSKADAKRLYRMCASNRDLRHHED